MNGTLRECAFDLKLRDIEVAFWMMESGFKSDRLKPCAESNNMKFNKEKCNTLHFKNWTSQTQNGQNIGSSNLEL